MKVKNICVNPPKYFWIMAGIALIIVAIGYAFNQAGPITGKLAEKKEALPGTNAAADIPPDIAMPGNAPMNAQAPIGITLESGDSGARVTVTKGSK